MPRTYGQILNELEELQKLQTNDQLNMYKANQGAHKGIARLQRKLASKQAQIDNLMLEFCPDEMTPAQTEEWGKNQKPVSSEQTKLKEGDPVWVYDRYRFAIRLSAIVKAFSTSNDGVHVTLCNSNNSDYPIGRDIWVHEQQLVLKLVT